MKPVAYVDLFKNKFFLKITGIVVISCTFFYLGKHWSDGYQSIVFFSTPKKSVAISPNYNISFNISSVIGENQTRVLTPSPVVFSPGAIQAPPPPNITFGIIDSDGKMRDSFEVGTLDKGFTDNWKSDSEMGKNRKKNNKIVVGKYEFCEDRLREFIPCLDNLEAIKRLNSTKKGEKFERHCPDKGKGLNCLVPPPKGYRQPISWPQSRDEVWYNNVPHGRLVEDKGGQNWIYIDKDKFKFPGGGTQFIHGADKYLDQIVEMVPEIAFGNYTRVVLDVGCGVASFGAYLLSRNVMPLSIAPKDVHENQIQFALERGVPSMVAAFATRRLLYPSEAFELIHCSRCRINWTRDDGILLLEANRMLRGGGYFAWAAQPVYKHEVVLEEQWEEMLNLTTHLCWRLVNKVGYIAIWQKPINNACYLNRDAGIYPPLCDPDDDPDNIWYVDLKACITRLPENGYGANITSWPARLYTPPNRLWSINIDAHIAREELFKAESMYWSEIIAGYIRAWHWKQYKLRNVLDMRAGFGGFAAALIDHGLNCWVLNVVPSNGPNTLPVIFDRGLIGVAHDWCESFDTYPRTYDLLHAAGLFTAEKRCSISMIVLEMDRILRPGGHVYIRDSIDVMEELQEVATAVGWHVTLRETAEGPHASYRILTCDKSFRHS